MRCYIRSSDRYKVYRKRSSITDRLSREYQNRRLFNADRRPSFCRPHMETQAQRALDNGQPNEQESFRLCASARCSYEGNSSRAAVACYSTILYSDRICHSGYRCALSDNYFCNGDRRVCFGKGQIEGCLDRNSDRWLSRPHCCKGDLNGKMN
jgi:hypothetical protein